ncbi:hypothetical protein P4E94_10730 [Pontiellaceae bacterium B12219]|nr:hypothetical protein [Pontiellaceae bacterium B12219]
MKKAFLILVAVGAVLFLISLTVSKQLRQKDSEGENKPASPAFLDGVDYQNPASRLSSDAKEYIAPAEGNNPDAEYKKIYNSISGGTEKDRIDLAHTLYKNGYRQNPETDLPIRFPSDDGIDHFTGMPLLKFPAAKIYRKYETDEEAAKEFEKNLLQREQSYEPIEPEEGMIPVQEAVAVAMKACPVEFDADQKPKVSLIRDFYLIFLWEHRRPYHSGTYHVANITIDAYSGEVRSVQVREDLKPSSKEP